MKVTLSLRDDDYEQLQAQAKSAKRTVEAILADRVATLSGISPQARTVILHGSVLTALESLLGSRSLEDGEDLLRRVRHLSGLEIGHHRVDLSPAQLLMAKQRADRLGLDFQTYLDEILHRVGTYVATELG
jgi:cytosine/adenosine deaminase-related metal-dependent hydrolase